MADGALHPFGYGLTYASPQAAWAPLPELTADGAGDSRMWFAAGVPAASWSLHLSDPSQQGSQTRITTVPAEALGGRARVTAEDFAVQEGARRFVISGGEAAVSLSTFDPVDISRETNGEVLLLVTLKMTDAPEWAGIAMRSGDGGEAAVAAVQLPESGEFVRYGLPLRCLRDKGMDMSAVTAPFILATEGAADFSLAEVRLGTDAEVVLPCV
jgi:beta-glucosidase